MQALDLAIRNFAVAEHLLHLEQLFADAAQHQPSPDYVVRLCAEMKAPEATAWHHLKNSRSLIGIQGSVTVPSCLTTTKGLDFLLRQAVVVSCSALESFIWDILRENALTVIKARGRKADPSLREITLTLDDYLSLEGYDDPDERLREIILKRFERGTLYDFAKIDEVMTILTVRDFWKEVTEHTGLEPKIIRGQLTDLIQRRNDIAHRADRPKEGTPAEECDPHGLRPINHAWVNTRITTAKGFVQAAAISVGSAMQQLDQIIAQKEEQQLAKKTMLEKSQPAPKPPQALQPPVWNSSPPKDTAEVPSDSETAEPKPRTVLEIMKMKRQASSE